MLREQVTNRMAACKITQASESDYPYLTAGEDTAKHRGIIRSVIKVTNRSESTMPVTLHSRSPALKWIGKGQVDDRRRTGCTFYRYSMASTY